MLYIGGLRLLFFREYAEKTIIPAKELVALEESRRKDDDAL